MTPRFHLLPETILNHPAPTTSLTKLAWAFVCSFVYREGSVHLSLCEVPLEETSGEGQYQRGGEGCCVRLRGD